MKKFESLKKKVNSLYQKQKKTEKVLLELHDRLVNYLIQVNKLWSAIVKNIPREKLMDVLKNSEEVKALIESISNQEPLVFCLKNTISYLECDSINENSFSTELKIMFNIEDQRIYLVTEEKEILSWDNSDSAILDEFNISELMSILSYITDFLQVLMENLPFEKKI